MNQPHDRVTLIREALATLKPSDLNIQDNSYQHAGHEGAKSGGGHFSVQITSPLFTGKSSVQRHQMVYAALGNLMHSEIHAVSIAAKAPDEG